MLSHAKLSSAGDTSEYFQADDYYSENGVQPGIWDGVGAAILGLSGAVDPEAFKDALQGKGPGGEALGQIKENGDRTAGWDFTFSPSKSISLMAMVAGDDRLIEAHDKAVSHTISVMEKQFSTVRVSRNKEIISEPTGNLLVAKFRHGLSRERDPNLHTHAVIVNGSKSADGTWRATDSRTLHAAHAAISSAYSNHLAKAVQALGYEITRESRDNKRMKFGGFEVKDVPASAITKLSKRHDAIEHHNASSEHHTAKARASSAMLTRPQKISGEAKDDFDNWVERLGPDCQILEALKLKAREHGPRPIVDRTEEAFKFALEHVSEQSAVFNRSDLIAAAFDFVPGQVDTGILSARIEEATARGELIESRVGPIAMMTSREMLALEKRMLSLTRQLSAPRPEAAPVTSEIYIGSVEFFAEQQSAVESIMTAPAGLQLVQGDAGVGKTRLVSAVVESARRAGASVIGIAPTHAAVGELKAVGLEAHTHASVLRGAIPDKEMKGALIILDDSSMIGTSDMVGLLEKLKAAKAGRIVFMGDIKQLEPITPGAPFRQQLGNAHVSMLKDIKRQTDKCLLQGARLASDGKYAKALDHLSAHITEIGSNGLVKAAFAEWQSIKEKTGEAPLTLSPTHDRRRELISLIRNDLKQTGELGAAEIEIATEQNLHLTGAQKRHAEFYGGVDRIAFIDAMPSQGFNKGSSWSIIDRRIKDNRLILENGRGQKRVLKLGTRGKQPNIALTGNTRLALSEGECVRFTRRVASVGINAGAVGYVDSIESDQLALTLEDGRKFTVLFASRAIQSLDHAYVITTHAAQGRTSDNVLVMIDAAKRNMLSRQQLYVQITRSRSGMSIVTDSIEWVRYAGVGLLPRTASICDQARSTRIARHSDWSRPRARF